jgi:hypothetical protein
MWADQYSPSWSPGENSQVKINAQAVQHSRHLLNARFPIPPGRRGPTSRQMAAWTRFLTAAATGAGFLVKGTAGYLNSHSWMFQASSAFGSTSRGPVSPFATATALSLK